MMTIIATPVLLASALTLEACAIGPDYRPPEISKFAMEPFREAAATGVTSAAPASSTWWELRMRLLSQFEAEPPRVPKVCPRVLIAVPDVVA
jgi:hypothetical protein